MTGWPFQFAIVILPSLLYISIKYHNLAMGIRPMYVMHACQSQLRSMQWGLHYMMRCAHALRAVILYVVHTHTHTHTHTLHVHVHVVTSFSRWVTPSDRLLMHASCVPMERQEVITSPFLITLTSARRPPPPLPHSTFSFSPPAGTLMMIGSC